MNTTTSVENGMVRGAAALAEQQRAAQARAQADDEFEARARLRRSVSALDLAEVLCDDSLATAVKLRDEKLIGRMVVAMVDAWIERSATGNYELPDSEAAARMVLLDKSIANARGVA